MIEKAFKGTPCYFIWLLFLSAIVGLGASTYLVQLAVGLKITGMSRDVTWGLYIAQFTYLVGVAASAVMLVLPYYFHHDKTFKKIIILGEFMAVAAISMCLLFIVVDLGQPQRAMNIILHPTPSSILFWDMIVLNGYLFINFLVGWVTLQAEKNDVPPPNWIKFFIYLSIVWAFSIHTVTAFLYAGIPGRHYWFTAIMAARFLASAFCSGPAILLLLILLLKKLTNFEPGIEAIKSLAKIITYAMCTNVFFFLLEIFTAFYSNVPGHMDPIIYLFNGFQDNAQWTGFMWTATVLAISCLMLLIPPKLRDNHNLLPWSLLFLVIATWIDKGIGLLVGGFTPNPFERVTPYTPTVPELCISMGIYATGAIILTVLWRIVINIKKEMSTLEI
ncbi:dimethyl sulfoxide reductase membrane subunit [Desulfovibrionales bacterium]